MRTIERDELVRGWIALVIGVVQSHCILWDHSPTYRAWAERQRERLRYLLRPVPVTWLRGRLARDVREAMGDG